MNLSDISKNETILLQILWEQGAVETGPLAALCKERMGWSSITVRRLLRKLKKRNAVTITAGTATALVSRDQLEAADWNNWLEDAFDLPDSTKPASKPHRTVSRKFWLVAALAAGLAIAVIVMFCLPTPLPDELEPCKTALDRWQNSESCHITLLYQRCGDTSNVLSAADAVEYWRSGNDWLKISYFTDWGVGNHGYMYRDGIAYYNVATEQGMLWVPDEFPQQDAGDMWPLTFVWDGCEFAGISVEETEDFKQISFTVLKTSSDRPETNSAPYHVCFRFDKNEHLESISVTTIGAGPYVTIRTYLLSSTDTGEITKFIQDQKVDTTDSGK